MHDYSIDRHPKEIVLFLLAFLAITAAPPLNDLMTYLVRTINAWTGFTWSVFTAVPVFGFFALLYWLFNKYLWKWPSLRILLLVPDLNGRWACDGLTILRDGERVEFNWKAEITITQSWSKLLVHLSARDSTSRSSSASVHHVPGVGYRLLYQYANDPGADRLDLYKHTGAAEILFNETCTSGEGSYFTDRHRQTVGTLQLRRV